MAEDLQNLLSKIQEEGLNKANTERKNIIDRANDEASEIIAKAKADAEALVKTAQAESKNLTGRAESAVKQAARDIVLKLEGELRSRLVAIVRENTVAAMTPELMGKIINEMVASYIKNKGTVTDLEVLVSSKSLDEMKEALKSSLRESFGREPRLFADMDIAGGLKVAISGSDVFYDFSDEAITEIVAAYIGPRLASVINGDSQ